MGTVNVSSIFKALLFCVSPQTGPVYFLKHNDFSLLCDPCAAPVSPPLSLSSKQPFNTTKKLIKRRCLSFWWDHWTHRINKKTLVKKKLLLNTWIKCFKRERRFLFLFLQGISNLYFQDLVAYIEQNTIFYILKPRFHSWTCSEQGLSLNNDLLACSWLKGVTCIHCVFK